MSKDEIELFFDSTPTVEDLVSMKRAIKEYIRVTPSCEFRPTDLDDVTGEIVNILKQEDQRWTRARISHMN